MQTSFRKAGLFITSPMKATFDLVSQRKAEGSLCEMQSLHRHYHQGGKMLPIPCISRKEELVYLIKGACKTDFFFLFNTKRVPSEKGQDGRLK